ncbi:MAG TPA: hypothetical protein VGE23_02715 [Candidatus Paceibacterota bacterium]
MPNTDDTQPKSAPLPADRGQYIRTMAKDMAALSGAPAPTAAAPKPTPVPAMPPAPQPKKEAPIAGVELPKEEEQPFYVRTQRPERRAPEPEALPSMQEASEIVTSAPAAAPVPAAEDRDAVLARLREKVAASAPVPQPAPVVPSTPEPAPIPVAPPAPPVPEPAPLPTPPKEAPKPEWQNVPEPLPQFSPAAEPAPARIPPLERAKDTYREPVAEAPRPVPAPAPVPDRIHTYSSDFAGRIDTSNASTFSVLAAEQDAGARAPAPEPKRAGGKGMLAIASGVLLLVLAVGGIYATYQFVMTMRETPIASLTVPSIVFADEYRKLEGTGGALLGALAASANGALVPGNVLVTYIDAQSADASGTPVLGPAGGDAFLRALQVPAPDILLRNIAAASTIGVVNAGGQTKPFFALRVESYERTYAGMLTWEPLLQRDLATLYPLYPVEAAPEPETASSTATTTATTTSVFIDSPAPALTRFEDAVVANRDVRVLRDTAGRSLVLYGYADKRTLLIARDEAAFEALLARLKAE